MQAVILAAGSGTRMHPLTLTQSKAMLPVANKPLLEWTIKSLEEVADEIIIVVNKSQTDITSYFKDCTFAYQEEQKGTADALAAAEEFINGRFILINADEFIPKTDIQNFAKGGGCKTAVFRVNNPGLFGVVEAKNNIVSNIVEKPQNPASNLVRCGMELLDKNIFPLINQVKPSVRGELEITDVYRLLIKEQEMQIFEVSKWITISYPWGFLDANRFVLEEHGSQIAKDVEIRPGAVIEEPVAIGSGSIVGPNCFIRKHSSIGKNCKVGQAVEIKNSIIMDNTFVSHLSYVGDSIIGRNCNVAAGVTFANLRLDEKTIKVNVNNQRIDSGHRKLGAVVGDNVKFGVNVTVMPGKKIWPGLMIPPCSAIKNDVTEQPDLKDWKGE
ncbi:MAG: NTP transferase domain-containing protein [Candidatus Aenigmarchaeota archaeon]|nr:NTP transferase domain-containing protein [Candidatus Aenigmarchaeota archaeon]